MMSKNLCSCQKIFIYFFNNYQRFSEYSIDISLPVEELSAVWYNFVSLWFVMICFHLKIDKSSLIITVGFLHTIFGTQYKLSGRTPRNSYVNQQLACIFQALSGRNIQLHARGESKHESLVWRIAAENLGFRDENSDSYIGEATTVMTHPQSHLVFFFLLCKYWVDFHR